MEATPPWCEIVGGALQALKRKAGVQEAAALIKKVYFPFFGLWINFINIKFLCFILNMHWKIFEVRFFPEFFTLSYHLVDGDSKRKHFPPISYQYTKLKKTQ